MSKKKSNKLYKTIRLEFKPDEYTETMLRNNCRYRQFLYNKCVEIVKSLEEKHSKGYIGDFDINDILSFIRDEYESNILYDNRSDWMEDYDYYFRGISECVVDDIQTIISRIIHERSNGKSSDINFIKFNPNNISFRFKNKIHYELKPKKNGLYHGNRLSVDKNPYILYVKINGTYGFKLAIRLKESFKKRYIDLNNVKEIAFKFHNEKWYVCLITKYTEYPNDYTKVKYNQKRKKLAGIDLGEENPITIFDNDENTIPYNLRFPKEEIIKSNIRISRLQKILDNKWFDGVGVYNQSKNYYKVLKKFHKANEHLINIKKDWHFKLAYWIVTHYEVIVVDEFHKYIIKTDDVMNSSKRRACNLSMQNKGMANFNKILIHMCNKYSTKYYRVIKNNIESNFQNNIFETTNTCSKCGYVNKMKLSLEHRTFKCESCSFTLNRDMNAAINCYNLYSNEYDKNLYLELIK